MVKSYQSPMRSDVVNNVFIIEKEDGVNPAQMFVLAFGLLASVLGIVTACIYFYKKWLESKAKRMKVEPREYEFEDFACCKDGNYCTCGISHRSRPHAIGSPEDLCKLHLKIPQVHRHVGTAVVVGCLISGCCQLPQTNAYVLIPRVVTHPLFLQEYTMRKFVFDIPILRKTNLDNKFFNITFDWINVVNQVDCNNPIPETTFFLNQYDFPVDAGIEFRGFILRNKSTFSYCSRSAFVVQQFIDQFNRLQVTSIENLLYSNVTLGSENIYCFNADLVGFKANTVDVARQMHALLEPQCSEFTYELKRGGTTVLTLNGGKAHEDLINYITAQGPEVRASASQCITRRCLIATDNMLNTVTTEVTENHRSKRDGWCFGFVIATYCPYLVHETELAATARSLTDAFNIKLDAVRELIKEESTQSMEYTKNSAVELYNRLDGIVSDTNKVIANMNTAINKKLVSLFNLMEYRMTRDHAKSELNDMLHSMRMSAVDVTQSYSDAAAAVLGVIECQMEADCSRVIQLLSKFNLAIALGSKKIRPGEMKIEASANQVVISLLQQKTTGVKERLIWYFPPINIAIDCNNQTESCDHCVIQKESTMDVSSYKDRSLKAPEIYVSPFKVQDCRHIGQTSHLLIPAFGFCLNVSVSTTSTLNYSLCSVQVEEFNVKASEMRMTGGIPPRFVKLEGNEDAVIKLETNGDEGRKVVETTFHDLVRRTQERSYFASLGLGLTRLDTKKDEESGRISVALALSILSTVMVCLHTMAIIYMQTDKLRALTGRKDGESEPVQFYKPVGDTHRLLRDDNSSYCHVCSTLTSSSKGEDELVILQFCHHSDEKLVHDGKVTLPGFPDQPPGLQIIGIKQCMCASVGTLKVVRSGVQQSALPEIKKYLSISDPPPYSFHVPQVLGGRLNNAYSRFN